MSNISLMNVCGMPHQSMHMCVIKNRNNEEEQRMHNGSALTYQQGELVTQQWCE